MHSRAEYIESTLRLLIAESTKKIDLLNEIRARENRKATKDELDRLDADQYSENGFKIGALESDIISLMLEAKASKREQKGGKRYQPFLIDILCT